MTPTDIQKKGYVIVNYTDGRVRSFPIGDNNIPLEWLMNQPGVVSYSVHLPQETFNAAKETTNNIASGHRGYVMSDGKLKEIDVKVTSTLCDIDILDSRSTAFTYRPSKPEEAINFLKGIGCTDIDISPASIGFLTPQNEYMLLGNHQSLVVNLPKTDTDETASKRRVMFGTPPKDQLPTSDDLVKWLSNPPASTAADKIHELVDDLDNGLHQDEDTAEFLTAVRRLLAYV